MSPSLSSLPVVAKAASVHARAAANLTLTPAERAWLKLLESWALAGGASAFLLVIEAIGLRGHIDWAVTLAAIGGAFVVASLTAAAKYFRAQGDPALADGLDTLAAALAVRLGVPFTPNAAPTGALPGIPLGTIPNPPTTPAPSPPLPVPAPAPPLPTPPPPSTP